MHSHHPPHILIVHIVQGRNLPSGHITGSRPYCVVSLGKSGLHNKTSVQKSLSPIWNQTFSFKTTTLDEPLVIDVFDAELFGHDDRIGSVSIPLNGKVEKLNWYSLDTKGEVEVELTLDGNPSSQSHSIPYHKINHIVVLVLENRSFDNLLGDFYEYPIGLQHAPPIFNIDEAGHKVFVEPTAKSVLSIDPDHDVPNVTSQLFGNEEVVNIGDVPTLQKFIINTHHAYKTKDGKTEDVKMHEVMKYFKKDDLSVIKFLVENFPVFSNWHASLAGPTLPNRLFITSGSTGGVWENDKSFRRSHPSLFSHLVGEDGYRVYYHDYPNSMFMYDVTLPMIPTSTYCKVFDHFKEDVKKKDLPKFTFIEPCYYSYGNKIANDMHPPHSVLEGEKLIAKIYQDLFVDNESEDTVLLITWDEHGSFYDHVVPPWNNEEIWENHPGEPNHIWKRLGLRVPAFLISPYLSHQLIQTQMDHCSIPRTVLENFNIPTTDFPLRVQLGAQNFLTLPELNWLQKPRKMPSLEHEIQILRAKILIEPVYIGDDVVGGLGKSMINMILVNFKNLNITPEGIEEDILGEVKEVEEEAHAEAHSLFHYLGLGWLFPEPHHDHLKEKTQSVPPAHMVKTLDTLFSQLKRTHPDRLKHKK